MKSDLKVPALQQLNWAQEGEPVTGARDPFYHNQKSLLLSQRGTAADYPGHNHDGAGGDQDGSGGRVEAGGQQTDVGALFHQSPHSHRQNGPACQLSSKLNSNQMHGKLFAAIYASLFQYLLSRAYFQIRGKFYNFNMKAARKWFCSLFIL